MASPPCALRLKSNSSSRSSASGTPRSACGSVWLRDIPGHNRSIRTRSWEQPESSRCVIPNGQRTPALAVLFERVKVTGATACDDEQRMLWHHGWHHDPTVGETATSAPPPPIPQQSLPPPRRRPPTPPATRPPAG